uniref:Uncharacterized protein n=1 Tax=Caenorhabditis tropicalis TaxID=1561998 RepID=A0A1I7UVZ1_9PELO
MTPLFRLSEIANVKQFYPEEAFENHNEEYERIDDIDIEKQEMNKTKPPFPLMIESPRKSMKSVKTKNGSSVTYSDIVSNDFDQSANSSSSYVNSMA